MKAERVLGIWVWLLAAATAAGASGIEKGPYLQNPTTSSIMVCWVSGQPDGGIVRYEPQSGGPGKISKESGPATYHHVKISGLRPYSIYRYQVECGGQTSEWHTFKTAALPNQPFRFVAYGDTRSQPQIHAEVVSRIIKFKPDFVIQSGDLVADGSNERLWDEFWQVVEPLVANTPYFPELGNHEGEAAPYFHFFPVPRQYSFDYGNIHFTALDTNLPPRDYPAQEAWLRKDLAAHQNATWRIVFCHHTPYTCVAIPARMKDAERLRARLAPILKAGHVQLMINGHDHNYQHHLADGITYIVSGGGGAPLYDLRKGEPSTVVAKKAYHDCEISVNGPTLHFRAVQPDGAVIDQFTLKVQ